MVVPSSAPTEPIHQEPVYQEPVYQEPRMTLEEAGPEPRDGFLWSILSCALFLPIGWFAVYKSASVHPQWQAGEYALAHRSAATAKTAAVIAAVVGVVVIVGVLAWLLISSR
ncbi:CD225/dispanin family protein [Gordonia sp. X0973]|uniref:CD225/dispanin family protein n=1 Tax=Gordonia sp. X0973 TaxID=2742602 RepID=UPI003463BC0D